VQLKGRRDQGREKADAALAAVDLETSKERWRAANLLAVETQVSADGSTVACIEQENMAGRDDIESDDASRLTVLAAATGRVRMRRPLGESLAGLLVSQGGGRVVAAGRGFSCLAYVADVKAGLVRRFRLPERGAWARALAAQDRELWVAGDRLYRVDLKTLEVRRGVGRTFLCLAARPGGGCYAGTADGKVVWLDRAGRVEREADLGPDIAPADPVRKLAALRRAPAPGSAALHPHEAPATFPLGPEYHLEYMTRGDIAVPRGDGIQPLEFAVRIPRKGRYRFTVTLANAKDHAARMGVLRINPDGRDGPLTAPVKKDPRTQAATLELGPGTYAFTLLPTGWKEDPLLRTLDVREAGK